MPRRAAPDGLRDIGGQILATGRLFLRNLPFDLLEADLRADFSHFGALLEVSGSWEEMQHAMRHLKCSA
jgi:RNA recognition motif-containing protein